MNTKLYSMYYIKLCLDVLIYLHCHRVGAGAVWGRGGVGSGNGRPT